MSKDESSETRRTVAARGNFERTSKGTKLPTGQASRSETRRRQAFRKPLGGASRLPHAGQAPASVREKFQQKFFVVDEMPAEKEFRDALLQHTPHGRVFSTVDFKHGDAADAEALCEIHFVLYSLRVAPGNHAVGKICVLCRRERRGG